MAQTWNNVLSYIKLETGAKLNLLELSDDELITGFKDHVLPYFSQFVPNKKDIWITPDDRIATKPGENLWKYKIPVPLGEYIIDIFDVVVTSTDGSYSQIDDDPYVGTKYSRSNIRGSTSSFGDSGFGLPGGGMIQTVIDNVYLDIADSLSVRNTWEFIPPNIISFDCKLSRACISYNTIHEDLNTIQPDYFNTVFKDLCLVKTLDWIIALRTKYESLATPVGEIKLNWQKLEQDANTKRAEIQQKLDAVPLDHFVEISV